MPETDVVAAPRQAGTVRPADGELIVFWTLPVTAAVWIAAFFLFPGFLHPMAPTLSAQRVAEFYRDPGNLNRVHYSMVVFNWFCVCLIPVLMLLVMQMRRMAHRTPILSYCMLGCAAGGPTLFLIANLFWLVAAFRPERDPAMTQMYNDLAWITYTCGVPFLIGQSVILALAIYLDRQPSPVFPRWVAHFNLVVAAALAPAAFAGLAMHGPVAWDGVLSFWVKNVAVAAWIAVTGVVLGQASYRRRGQDAVEVVAAGVDA